MAQVTSPATSSASNRAAAGYLIAQAALVLGWWGAVFASQAVRGWFFPYGGLDPAFAAFVLPDLGFIVGGSLYVARKRFRGDPAARASGVLLGAVGYATVYTLGWTFALQAPAAGVLVMLVMSAGTFRACR